MSAGSKGEYVAACSSSHVRSSARNCSGVIMGPSSQASRPWRGWGASTRRASRAPPDLAGDVAPMTQRGVGDGGQNIATTTRSDSRGSRDFVIIGCADGGGGGDPVLLELTVIHDRHGARRQALFVGCLTDGLVLLDPVSLWRIRLDTDPGFGCTNVAPIQGVVVLVADWLVLLDPVSLRRVGLD